LACNSDFEVEVTIVIGKPATRVSADEADEFIAGYTLGNDLTMHFAWWRELRNKSPINDNTRMKNFGRLHADEPRDCAARSRRRSA
jgi:2-keto-4-pentenoate hydratase/2-oxohepta-3-ene-1,7-dioic acid hydratase in catechol pathway